MHFELFVKFKHITGQFFLCGANNVKNWIKARLQTAVGQECSDESKTGEALAEDASLSATSPQRLCGRVTWGSKFHIALSIRSCPLTVKGPCIFAMGCLDAWMTVSDQHGTSDITCCTVYVLQ